MLELKLTKKMLALGLFVGLSTYNLAYANTTLIETPTTQPVKEQPSRTSEGSSTRIPTSNTTRTSVPSDKKKASSVKPSAGATNGCACSCPTATGRAAAGRGPWWDCMKGCLRAAGVSPVQLALCAASCVTGFEVMCAICVAVDVTVFTACAIGCASYGVGGHGPIEDDHMPYQVRKTPRKLKRQGNSRVLSFAGQQ